MFEKQAIAEVKKSLSHYSDPNEPYINFLKADERKGVQQLLVSWEKALAKEAAFKEQAYQMQHYERQATAQGFQLIAGIDEVGRGPLAGPVVAAAVILPVNFDLLEVNDSKQLSSSKRDHLFDKIQDSAVAIGIGIVDEGTIDQINIYQATKLAMKRAVAKLSFTPDYLLIDAMVIESLPIEQASIIKGDAKSVSIAAASIIAKVTRDRLMAQYDRQFPGYGFAHNAGYGTKEHLAGLTALGPCEIHRKTFAPVKDYFTE